MSKDYTCGEEMLTIAAMTSIQVSSNPRGQCDVRFMVYQDVFVIPDGAPGALAELERRKFTAEEGVGISSHLTAFTC